MPDVALIELAAVAGRVWERVGEWGRVFVGAYGRAGGVWVLVSRGVSGAPRVRMTRAIQIQRQAGREQSHSPLLSPHSPASRLYANSSPKRDDKATRELALAPRWHQHTVTHWLGAG